MTIEKQSAITKAKELLPQKGAGFTENFIRAFLVAIIVCAVFLLIFTFYLSDYQRSLPADTAARILEAYNENDSAVFAQYNDNHASAFIDDYKLAAYKDLSFPREKLYYCKGTAKNPDETVYEFKAGNMHIATLTTRTTKNSTFFGFQGYEVISFTPRPIAHYTIVAPLGTLLMMDGVQLHKKYPPNPGYAKPCFKNVVESNISEVYSIPDYDALGALSVKNATAEDYEIDIDEENYSVIITTKPEQAIKAQIVEFTEEFLKEYLIFTTKRNAPRGTVLKMTHPKTDFYKTLLQYSNTWGKQYVSDGIEDIVINEIKAYSQTEYSCHASLTYIIVRSDGVTKNIDFSAVIDLTNNEGKWMVVAIDL